MNTPQSVGEALPLLLLLPPVAVKTPPTPLPPAVSCSATSAL